jgi:hypothetical protein
MWGHPHAPDLNVAQLPSVVTDLQASVRSLQTRVADHVLKASKLSTRTSSLSILFQQLQLILVGRNGGKRREVRKNHHHHCWCRVSARDAYLHSINMAPNEELPEAVASEICRPNPAYGSNILHRVVDKHGVSQGCIRVGSH